MCYACMDKFQVFLDKHIKNQIRQKLEIGRKCELLFLFSELRVECVAIGNELSNDKTV